MNPEIVSQLVENHRAFLSFLQKRVGDRGLAEDILQDAFVRAVESSGEIRDDTAATAWFYRLLRNAVVDRYRRTDARSRALEAFAQEMKDAVEPPPDVEQALCACVDRLATTLKPEYARAIKRVELESVPVGEYAKEENISANNAAVRVHRARQALKKQLEVSCGTCTSHGCLDCSCDATKTKSARSPQSHHA